MAGPGLSIITLIPLHQEMYIRDLHFESEKLEPTDSVDSAQAATVALYADWHHTKSAKVTVKRNLSTLFSPGRVQKEKLEDERRLKETEAFEKYYEQGDQGSVFTGTT